MRLAPAAGEAAVAEEQKDRESSLRNIVLKILLLTMILVAIGVVWVAKNGIPAGNATETETSEPNAASADTELRSRMR